MGRITQQSRTQVTALALALAALSCGLGGCAVRATPNDIKAEIAELREVERDLRDEIAALRSDLARLTAAFEAAAAADALPRTQSQPEAPTKLPVAVPAPSAAIAAVLDDYRLALEREDLQSLRRIYGGDLPADDLHYLTLWFDRTDELDVSMATPDIDVTNGTALAVVQQTMTYTLSPTQQRRTVRLTVRMEFARRDGEWQLTNLDPRR